MNDVFSWLIEEAPAEEVRFLEVMTRLKPRSLDLETIGRRPCCLEAMESDAGTCLRLDASSNIFYSRIPMPQIQRYALTGEWEPPNSCRLVSRMLAM